MLRQAAATVGEEALGGHIISMTHRASDILAALWLMELRTGPGAEAAPGMDIVPLFETIEDLARARDIVRDMLSDPVYRRHLARRRNVQIVMIGYSDSTKDGGYLAACWALYRTQSVLSRLAQEHGVRLVFFHGRGGSLGRGGGPAARSILALPPESLGAGLRMTEQGEVLADRYDDPRIAGRHLEQVIWATLAASVQPLTPPREEWLQAMEELSREALAAYRALVEEPVLPPLFRAGHSHPRDRVPSHCLPSCPPARGARVVRPARHSVGVRVDAEPLHDPGLVRPWQRVPGIRPPAQGRLADAAGDVRGLAVFPRHAGQRGPRAGQVRHRHRPHLCVPGAGRRGAFQDLGDDRIGVRPQPRRGACRRTASPPSWRRCRGCRTPSGGETRTPTR